MEDDWQYMHIRVEKNGKLSSMFSIVYASPNPMQRKVIWGKLARINSNMRLAWFLCGGFNVIAHSLERQGGTANRLGTCHLFQSWLQNIKLHDIDFVGSKFI